MLLLGAGRVVYVAPNILAHHALQTKQEFALASNAAGFSCTGQKVNGKLKYIQNGA